MTLLAESSYPRPYYEDDCVRLYLADSREFMGWREANWLITDPPYGMAFRSGMGGAFGDSAIVNDEDPTVRDEILRRWGDKPALIFGRWSVDRPLGTRMVLTWEKGNHVGMGDLSLPWKPNTEEIYVLGSGFEGHRGSSVLRHLAIAGTVGREQDGSRVHPMQKPVSLLRDLIAKCPPGVIADPFAGSGSTLRAAKDLGRQAIGVEIHEPYCEAAAKLLAQEVFDMEAA